jgi:hypothetical protein
MDQALRELVGLFVHLQDKDMFADSHRSLLAKRLLNKRSISSDAEKFLIGQLKMLCGAQFTSKLEGMLHDYNSSAEAQAEYDSYVNSKSNGNSSGSGNNRAEKRAIVFTNTLLTASYWPTYRPRAVTLPPELSALQAHYSDWHKSKYGVRSLQWVHTLGDVSIAMTVHNDSGGVKSCFEVSVSLLQAVVLRAFDNVTTMMSFAEIKANTGITEDEALKRVLHSLACQKFKLLVKSSESRNVLLTDCFVVNHSFNSKLRKFRVPMASLEFDSNDGASGAAGGGPGKHVSEERGSTVDACIVRVMKARRLLAHTALQGEVMRQIVGFAPDIKFIKQRIESLIDREYLERDPADAKLYKYIP